ncbi:MAG: type II secretion system protein GspJ [Desulfovibrionales bacterium]
MIPSQEATIQQKGRAYPAQAMNGFTLLEIMVALGILGLLMAALFAAYTGTLEVAGDIEERTGTAEAARMVIGLMDRDLTCLIGNDEKNESDEEERISEEGSVFRGGGTSSSSLDSEDRLVLEFSTSSTLEFSTEFPSHTISKIRYVLRPTRPEKISETFSLVRRQLRFPEINSEWEEVELADQVREMTVSFMDHQGMETDTWDSSTIEEDAEYPALVRIKLTLEEESGTLREYPLLVSLGRQES